MRRLAFLTVLVAAVVLAGVSVEQFMPSLVGDVQRVLARPQPEPYPWLGSGETDDFPDVAADFARGAFLAMLGVLVAAFPAGVAAVALTTTGRYRDRVWSVRWRYVFRTGAVLQGGCMGLCLMLLALAALSDGALLLTMAILLGPDLVVSLLALPSWARLQAATAPMTFEGVTNHPSTS